MSLYQRLLFERDRELYHHGIAGQKWGVRKVPWYPIADYMAAKKRDRAESKVHKDYIKKVDSEIENIYKQESWRNLSAIAKSDTGKAIFNDFYKQHPETKELGEKVNLVDMGTVEDAFLNLDEIEQAIIKAKCWNNIADEMGQPKVEPDPNDTWLMWGDWDQGGYADTNVYSCMMWLDQEGIDTRKMDGDLSKYIHPIQDAAEEFCNERFKGSTHKLDIEYMLSNVIPGRISYSDPQEYIKALKKAGY